MTRKNINRIVRAVLALIAFALAGQQYAAAGFSGATALFGFLGVWLTFQAATGHG